MRMCAHMHEYMVVRVSAQCRQCLHVCAWTWVLHARMNFYMPVCVPVFTCVYMHVCTPVPTVHTTSCTRLEGSVYLSLTFALSP